MQELIRQRTVKRFISFSSFLFILWLVFVHLTYLFRNTNWDKLNIPVFRTEEKQTIDVAFIGGSNVYRFWNPLQAYSEQGFVSYNYAPSSTPAATTIFAIKDISKTQTPKLFVVDIRMFLSIHWTATINGGLRNIIDAQNLDINRLEAIEYYRKLNNLPMSDCISEFIDLIYYHNNTTALTNELNWQLADNRLEPELADMYFENGFYPGIDHIFMEDYAINYSVKEKAELQGTVEKCLRDLLEYCCKNNIPLLMTSSPFAMTEEDVKEINSFKNIISEYDIPFFNMNELYEDMGIDFHKDFYDTGHVNILGARKFTGELASYISDNYDLPDHRGDAQFSIWDSKYEEYCEYEKRTGSYLLDLIGEKDQIVKNEEIMRNIEDPIEWFSYANNKNMMLLMLLDKPLERQIPIKYKLIFDVLGVTDKELMETDSYISVFAGEKKYASMSEKQYSGKIDNMWGTRDDVEYLISLSDSSKIVVNGIDYCNNERKGLHIVVLDVNTGDVADSVCVDIDRKGDLVLYHEPVLLGQASSCLQ